MEHNAAGIMQKHMERNNNEVFSSLYSAMISSPETMNVIHKVSENEAVWLHVSFPKPDDPNHIDDFLRNHIKQNLLAAEQLERSVNPTYKPKIHAINGDVLAQYRSNVLDIAISRNLMHTITIFLQSPEFFGLHTEAKEQKFLDIAYITAMRRNPAHLKTLLAMRDKLGLAHIDENAVIKHCANNITKEIQSNSLLLYQFVPALTTFAEVFTLSKEDPHLQRLFLAAYGQNDSQCHNITNILTQIGIDKELSKKTDNKDIIDTLTCTTLQNFKFLNKTFSLSELPSNSPILHAIANDPAIGKTMIGKPNLALLYAELVVTAFERDNIPLPKASNPSLEVAIKKFQSRPPVPQKPSEGLFLSSVGLSPPSRGLPAIPGQQKPEPIKTAVPQKPMPSSVRSVLRVNDIVKAMPAVVDLFNKESQSPITFDSNAFLEELNKVVNNSTLGVTSLKQSIITPNGIPQPKHIEKALKIALNTDEITAKNLVSDCIQAVKSAQQKG